MAIEKICKLLGICRNGFQREEAEVEADAKEVASEEAEIAAAAASKSASVDTEPWKGQKEKGRKAQKFCHPRHGSQLSWRANMGSTTAETSAGRMGNLRLHPQAGGGERKW